jgi:hypothetical protein
LSQADWRSFSILEFNRPSVVETAFDITLAEFDRGFGEAGVAGGLPVLGIAPCFRKLTPPEIIVLQMGIKWVPETVATGVSSSSSTRQANLRAATMMDAATQQNTNGTSVGQIKEALVLAPNTPDLQAKYDLYNNVVLGLLFVAGAIAIAIAVFLVLSSRKSAELMKAKDRDLALVLKDKDAQNERIKQEKDEQIEQIKSTALVEAEKSAILGSRRAAAIEKENLELKQQLANRRLTEKQHKILVDILSKKPGRIIIETMGDPESGLFAEDILKTFIDSGWELRGRLLPQGVVWTGLILYKSSDPDAVTVMQALKFAEIPFSVGSETRTNATIMVGGKPPLF